MTLETISNIIAENSSKLNEGVESSDIAQTPTFIGKLVRQTFAKSVLPKITSVMPLTVPSGFVYSLLAYYQGIDEDNKFENTKVIYLRDTFTGDINTEITLSNGAVVTVEYFEEKHLLIKVISGNVLVGSTIGSIIIDQVYSTRVAIKKLFKNYSKVADQNSESKNIGIKTIRTLMETNTRKIKSTMTQESIQDLAAQYGEGAEDIIVDIMSSEIALEMDKEVIDYMRSIATQKSDLVLNNVNSADLFQAFMAIPAKINRELASLSKKHGKNITGFVVCSNAVVSSLITAGVMSFGESGNLDLQVLTDNSNAIGTMQQYVTVIQDKFADEDYVLVGWKQNGDGVNGRDGNAGVIFSPYNMAVTEWVDPESGKLKKMVLNRYGFQRNAFDEGGDIESDYFSLFGVDLTQLVGYTD